MKLCTPAKSCRRCSPKGQILQKLPSSAEEHHQLKQERIVLGEEKKKIIE